MSINNVVRVVLLQLVAAWMCGPTCRASEVPRPFICMYGHNDGRNVTAAFRKLVPRVNVIEGTSRNAAFIRELRGKGCVYAAHVNSPPGATVNELLQRWRAPFKDDLGGKLIGGYDAIAIDELRQDLDGSKQSQVVCEALEKIRGEFPDKQIYAAATWQLGRNAGQHVEQLRAVEQFVDVLMLEVYLRESRPSYGYFPEWAEKLEKLSPGLLAKTVYGLGVAQRGYIFDDSSQSSFLAHLDTQFHRIRTGPRTARMQGVMFWVYYRSQVEVTPEYLARLSQHYFHEKKTVRFGDGHSGQLVSNPQLESMTGWELTSRGGQVGLFLYKDVKGLEADHDSNDWSGHGKGGLRMIRGPQPNRIVTRVQGVNPSRVHVASAWVHSSKPNQRAGIRILGRDDRVLAQTVTARAGTGSQWDRWTRLLVQFKPDGASVRLELTDSQADQGTVLYWDYIELESAWPVSDN